MKIPKIIRFYLEQVKLPAPDSYKGQNGKLLIIGGSELFHAASKWSLDVASKIVDMVFYSSIPQNNELIKEAKSNFYNGIVVPRTSLDDYIKEADCVLVGPGMERTADTARLTNNLLQQFGDKRWVIDAGALQMVDPNLLQPQHIITPHSRELENLKNRSGWSELEKKPLVLLKGPIDKIFIFNQTQKNQTNKSQAIEIEGGNVGMTKGGTGDVLAGLVAALYCAQSQAAAAVVGSFVNKKAGDALYHQVGPYYNASDLVIQVPKTMWQLLKKL